MASLDLTMFLKLNDKASRKLASFNSLLDKTKKKLNDIGRLQAKNLRGGGGGVGGAANIAGGNSSLITGAAAGLAASKLAKNTKEQDKNTTAVNKNKAAAKEQGGVFKGISAKWLGLAAVVGTATVKIFNTGREFETLRATLKSVIPETDDVNVVFGFLTDLTKKLPDNLTDVTTAFIRMSSLGLNPTEEAMLSFGNTAAASGADILQLVEAVADASTGEFERLKTFGIKTKREGDKVLFTFRGMTDEVDNNSAAIAKFLESIGSDLPSAYKAAGAFAGAATGQMVTINGVLSNLGVELDSVADRILEAFQPALKGTINLLTTAVKWVGALVMELRKWVIFMVGGLDQLVIKMDQWRKGVFATAEEQKELTKETERLLNANRESTDVFVKNLMALTDSSEASKKYAETLRTRAKTVAKVKTEEDKLNSGLQVLGHTTQTLTEFMIELDNEVLDDIVSAENATAAYAKLNEMFNAGVLSSDELSRSIQKLDEILGVELPEAVEEISVFWNQAFRNMQGDLAGFFDSAASGKFTSFKNAFTSLATTFSNTIRRMVSEWLAAKVLTSGFGMFGAATPGGGMQGFADGGRPPVNVPSIVGERGPEIFMPDTAGTIIPNNQMGGNVSINISAMDGPSVMASLEQNKRAIAEMVMGTSRTFNLG